MKNYCLIFVGTLAAFTMPAIAEEKYNPTINPADFTVKITNPMFNMPVGKTMVYDTTRGEVKEHIEISVSGETMILMGVPTLLIHDIVSVGGIIKEDTKDYIAQHKDGTVWYFGEQVDNFENGKLKDHHGSWLAGVDNAQPGIWMNATQIVGQDYRQEFYRGKAEDWAKVLATGETVKVAAGTFQNCTKTLEWTPLEPDGKAYKYNCPDAGGIVLEEELKDGTRVELVSFTN